jgi:hypothetical protein
MKRRHAKNAYYSGKKVNEYTKMADQETHKYPFFTIPLNRLFLFILLYINTSLRSTVIAPFFCNFVSIVGISEDSAVNVTNLVNLGNYNESQYI